MASVRIPDDVLQQLALMAEREMRSIEQQAAWLIAEGIRRREERAAATERQRRSRASRDVTVTSLSRHRDVTPPLPPEGSPFPFPNPSQSHSYAPLPPRSHDAHPHEGVVAEATVTVLEAAPAVDPSPVAAPPSPSSLRPAPKPSREKYSAAFEAWWALRKWGGSKQEAWLAWKALRLDVDDDLREKLMAATVAQISNKAAVEAAGGFTPNFKDGCRWLRGGRWEDNLEPLPPASQGPGVPGISGEFRPSLPPRRPAAPTVADVGAEWLRKRREAGL